MKSRKLRAICKVFQKIALVEFHASDIAAEIFSRAASGFDVIPLGGAIGADFDEAAEEARIGMGKTREGDQRSSGEKYFVGKLAM